MVRLFNALLLSAFAAFALAGYGYFGSPEYTRWYTDNTFFQVRVVAFLDQLLGFAGKNTTVVGDLSQSRGDLTFRPHTELVFLPARSGQRFYSGTVVSSGDRSRGIIHLLDRSEIVLEANSTILLEAPDGSWREDGLVSLKVLKGSVTAQKKIVTSALKVRVLSPKGRSKDVDERKVVVVAPRVMTETLQANPFAPEVTLKKPLPPKVESAGTPAAEIPSDLLDEYVGYVDQAPASVQKYVAQNEALMNLPPPKPRPAPLKVAPTSVADLEKPLAAPSAEAPPVAPAPIEAPPPVAVVPPPPPPPPPPAPVLPPPPPPPPVVTLIAPRNTQRSPASTAGGKRVAKNKPLMTAPTKVYFEAGPEGNDLTNALFLQRSGHKQEARRLLARVLTNRQYRVFEFNDAARLALDGLVQGYIEDGQCDFVSALVENIRQSFPPDSPAQSWATGALTQIAQGCKRAG